MIFVSGPSGTGKTTSLQRFVESNPQFVLLRASSILRDCGQPTHNLNFNQLHENQLVLHQWLRRRSFGSATILDGHTIIPSEEGLFHLPLTFFEGLSIRILVFLRTDPALLAVRKGLHESYATELGELQMIELDHMQKIAVTLECPFVLVSSSNPSLLEETLLQYGMTAR